MEAKKKMIAMIIPWFLLFFVGIGVNGLIMDSTKHPSFVLVRELYKRPETSGDLSTLGKLTITTVVDADGETIMQGQPWIIICPGDTVTLGLEMTVNGHIARYGLINPADGQMLSVSYSTSEGSPVIDYAELSLIIPVDADTSYIYEMPFQADMYLIQYIEKTTESVTQVKWFRPVKSIPVSDLIGIPLATSEQRDTWIERERSTVLPNLLKFTVLGVAVTALILLSRKSFFFSTCSFAIFTGSATTMVGGIFYEKSNIDMFVGVAPVIAVVLFVFIRVIRHYHSDLLRQVFE